MSIVAPDLPTVWLALANKHPGVGLQHQYPWLVHVPSACRTLLLSSRLTLLFANLSLDRMTKQKYAIQYRLCTNAELRKFLKGRTGNDPAGLRRMQLVGRLEQLDRQITFPFFDLPAELRNMVYGFLLSSEHNQSDPWHCWPQILQSCPRARDEGKGHLYGEQLEVRLGERAIRSTTTPGHWCSETVISSNSRKLPFCYYYHQGETVRYMWRTLPLLLRRFTHLKLHITLTGENGAFQSPSHSPFVVLHQLLFVLSDYFVSVKFLDLVLVIDIRHINPVDLRKIISPVERLSGLTKLTLTGFSAEYAAILRPQLTGPARPLAVVNQLFWVWSRADSTIAEILTTVDDLRYLLLIVSELRALKDRTTALITIFASSMYLPRWVSAGMHDLHLQQLAMVMDRLLASAAVQNLRPLRVRLNHQYHQ